MHQALNLTDMKLYFVLYRLVGRTPSKCGGDTGSKPVAITDSVRATNIHRKLQVYARARTDEGKVK